MFAELDTVGAEPLRPDLASRHMLRRPRSQLGLRKRSPQIAVASPARRHDVPAVAPIGGGRSPLIVAR